MIEKAINTVKEKGDGFLVHLNIHGHLTTCIEGLNIYCLVFLLFSLLRVMFLKT